MITIFSYQRKEMLTNLLSELEKHEPIVLDDGSDFKLESSNFHQFEHGGKENFYKLWQFAFNKAQQNNDDFFMFMPSDFSNIDLNRIFDYYNQLRHEPFACNIINDNRKSCWGSYHPIKHNSELNRVFFTDCGFFCNRLALEKIDFHIKEVPKSRFNRTNISSGVGQYLTYIFNKKNVKMYTPISSLAFHGEHESLMHPEERIKTPLISR
jgi:hypothetical protein